MTIFNEFQVPLPEDEYFNVPNMAYTSIKPRGIGYEIGTKKRHLGGFKSRKHAISDISRVFLHKTLVKMPVTTKIVEPRFFCSPRHPSIEITWWESCPQDFSAYKGVGFSIDVGEIARSVYQAKSLRIRLCHTVM